MALIKDEIIHIFRNLNKHYKETSRQNKTHIINMILRVMGDKLSNFSREYTRSYIAKIIREFEESGKKVDVPIRIDDEFDRGLIISAGDGFHGTDECIEKFEKKIGLSKEVENEFERLGLLDFDKEETESE